MPGFVESIYVARGAGAPVERVEEVAAIEGCGLADDRYSEGTGHWSRFGRVCQVTLIAAEDLAEPTRLVVLEPLLLLAAEPESPDGVFYDAVQRHEIRRDRFSHRTPFVSPSRFFAGPTIRERGKGVAES